MDKNLEKDQATQMIEKALLDIEVIQLRGHAQRLRIEEEKLRILSAVEERSRQEADGVEAQAKERMNLIQAMGEAAAVGDLEEMRRIQGLLNLTESI